MFKFDENTDLNQISLTGVRALVLLGLLMRAPRTFSEIKQTFVDLKIMEPDHSDDIIRIDLNTLRTMGCDITKANAKTGFKYVLTKHPFSLNITKEEIALLKKVYKKIKDNVSIETLIEYDNLFNNLAEYIFDNEIKEALYGVSALKEFKVRELKELLNDCRENKILTLIYHKPSAKEDSQKEIVAQELVFNNDKIYLRGYDINKKESVSLNLRRVKSILSRVLGGNLIDIKTFQVRFFLKNFGVNKLEKNESIIETRDDGYVIEGNYHNEFIACQRVLSFGASCTVLEPQEFREKVIEKLREMRKNYNG